MKPFCLTRGSISGIFHSQKQFSVGRSIHWSESADHCKLANEWAWQRSERLDGRTLQVIGDLLVRGMQAVTERTSLDWLFGVSWMELMIFILRLGVEMIGSSM